MGDLCKRGVEQGILIFPQASLSGGIAEEDMGLKYENRCKSEEANALYTKFVDSLLSAAQELIGTQPSRNPWLTPQVTTGAASLQKGRNPQIVAGVFGSRQVMEFSSA